MKKHISSSVLVSTILIAFIVYAAASTGSLANSEEISELNKEQLDAVLAMEADAEYGEYLAGECLTCHLATGGDGSIPRIHGRPKAYLAGALLEYKNLQRSNTVMQGVASALGDEELAALVAYLSQQ